MNYECRIMSEKNAGHFRENSSWSATKQVHSSWSATKQVLSRWLATEQMLLYKRNIFAGSRRPQLRCGLP